MKARKIKVWLYLWPQDKKLTDGRVTFGRLSKNTVKDLDLREFKYEMIPIGKQVTHYP